MNHNWRFWARQKQLPPDDPWFIYGQDNAWWLWIILSGRGFGKTWVGANWINECAESGNDEHVAIVGRDAHDVRTYMVEGESGLIQQAKPWFQPSYEPSKRIITYPNGCTAHIYYSESPESVRGPNHSKAWCDEPGSWQDADKGILDEEATTWGNLMLTMRKGKPQVLVTGTPRPRKLIRQLIKGKLYPDAHIIRGNSMENRANLSEVFFNNVIRPVIGTRLGRQEVEGELLDDNPGALWKREWIDGTRITEKDVPSLERIVVAIDPSTAGEDTDENLEITGDAVLKAGAEAGIIVAGKFGRHYYVLADSSTSGSPLEWAKKGLVAYGRYMADCVVAERNNGGKMVDLTIKLAAQALGMREVNVSLVWASRGKRTRAEPISALYEQRRVHHVGAFEILEDQLCFWEPGESSPDRLDALVWALTELAEVDKEITTSDDADYKKFWAAQAGDALPFETFEDNFKMPGELMFTEKGY